MTIPAAVNKKIRVMVVDDSMVARSMLIRGLNAHPRIEVVGYAINTLDAKNKIPQYQPDVVTMDVEMPGQNGIEFLKQYLAPPPHPRHPGVLLKFEGVRRPGRGRGGLRPQA